MFKGATILITGGTGSFGKNYVNHMLKYHQPKKLIIYSRDEMKQWDMARQFVDDNRVRFFIGDVRDRNRLYRALDGVDYVVHAAATKIVPTAEYNPFECIKTNIDGAMNLIDAALDKGVQKVVALSTDKACSPANLYGATKLASDKLFVAANVYGGEGGTQFSVVRYGNVMGSRGSVIPYFLSLPENEPLPVTDTRMTRFMITLEEGIALVNRAFNDMRGGEIFVKKIPSMNVMDIAEAVRPGCSTIVCGVRPGEKLHEKMISSEDSNFTFEFESHFVICSPLLIEHISEYKHFMGNKVADGFEYVSDTNTDWYTVEMLKDWIVKNRNLIGIV